MKKVLNIKCVLFLCKPFTEICCDSVNYSSRYCPKFLDGPGSNPGGDEIFRTCPDRP